MTLVVTDTLVLSGLLQVSRRSVQNGRCDGEALRAGDAAGRDWMGLETRAGHRQCGSRMPQSHPRKGWGVCVTRETSGPQEEVQV